MQLDCARLDFEARLESEVAVVGAGPAGIVVALELADAGHRVLLIESGGEGFDAGTQRLGDTAGADPPHAPMALATRRQIGGASNLWAGRCVPFDPIDFEPRAIVGPARWPVSYEELSGFFARACEWLICGEPAFDASAIPELARDSLIPGWPGGEILASSLERWSLPTNFRRSYGARLRRSSSLRLVTDLTCTEIVCRPEGGVAHLVGRDAAGRRVQIRAGRYVLACGGLESTRLLLASDGVHRDGIGNHAGHLGHWYMGHVESHIADVHFATPASRTIYGYERDARGVYLRRRFTFSPEYILAHDLPNAAFWLINPKLGEADHASGVLSFLYLALRSPLGSKLISEAIRLRQLETPRPSPPRRHLLNIARQPGPTAAFALGFGSRRLLARAHKPPGVFVASPTNVYPLNYHGEHLPHYRSRVELSPERDALGVPRLRTALRFEDGDIDAVIRSHRHFDGYLRRHGLGRLELLHEDPAAAVRSQLFGGYHQAGTTRMSRRPQDGVLDADLAVHGFDDLFVASSSSFVTSSQANTTFMIVVFALRLADRLRRSLRA